MDFGNIAKFILGGTMAVFFLGFIGFVFFYLISFGWAFVSAFFWFFSMIGYHTVLMTLFLILLVANLILGAVRFFKSMIG